MILLANIQHISIITDEFGEIFAGILSPISFICLIYSENEEPRTSIMHLWIMTKLINQVGKNQRKNQDQHPYSQHHDGFCSGAFPLFQQDSPYIAESNIQRHQDAPREQHHHTSFGQKTFTQRQSEELRIPQDTG